VRVAAELDPQLVEADFFSEAFGPEQIRAPFVHPGEGVEKREPSYTVGGNANCTFPSYPWIAAMLWLS